MKGEEERGDPTAGAQRGPAAARGGGLLVENETWKRGKGVVGACLGAWAVDVNRGLWMRTRGVEVISLSVVSCRAVRCELPLWLSPSGACARRPSARAGTSRDPKAEGPS